MQYFPPVNSPNGAPYNPAAAAITGGTAIGLTKLGVRDTSAAFDAVVAATSSTPLTAERTLTFDLVNAARTLRADQLVAVGADALAGARGLTQVSGTFGADAAIWDLGALACDTKGGFSLSLSTILKGTGAAASLQLAINGAQANLAIIGSLLGPASITPFCNLMVGGAPVAPTSMTELVVRCDAPESSNGRRLLSCVSTYGGTYVFDKQIVLLPGLGEVTSVGIYIETPGAILIDGTNSHYTLTRRIAP